MKLTRKRLTATGIVLAAGLFLAGCGGSSDGASSGAEASKGAPRVAYFATSVTAQFETAHWNGVQEAAKAAGGTATRFDGQYDANMQINQVQDAVTTGKFDILLITPLNAPGLVPAVQSAIDQGIVVVALTNTISTVMDGLNSDLPELITVGLDLRENGRDIASLIIDGCKGIDPCEAAFLMGNSGDTSEMPRTKAVKEVLAGEKHIKLVPDQEGGYFKEPGLQATQSIITANPGLDVIATVSGETTLGALQALQEAGLEGKVKLISDGASATDVEKILAGTFIGSPVVLPQTEGRTGAEFGIKKFKNEPYEKVTDSSLLSPLGRIATAKTLGTPEGKAFVPEW
jgi:ribose transport system substrate-binding protein